MPCVQLELSSPPVSSSFSSPASSSAQVELVPIETNSERLSIPVANVISPSSGENGISFSFTNVSGFISIAYRWLSPLDSPRTQVDSLPEAVTPTAESVGSPTSVGVINVLPVLVDNNNVNDESRSKCLYPLVVCSFISGVLGVIFRPIGEDKDFNDQAFFVAKCVGVGGVLALVIIFIDKCCDDLPGPGAGSFDDFDDSSALSESTSNSVSAV
jgi:hypothetical protein